MRIKHLGYEGFYKTLVEDTLSTIHQKEWSNRVDWVLENKLSEVESQVIRLRFGLGTGIGMPMHKVGEQLGLSTNWICQVEQAVWEKLNKKSVRDFLYFGRSLAERVLTPKTSDEQRRDIIISFFRKPSGIGISKSMKIADFILNLDANHRYLFVQKIKCGDGQWVAAELGCSGLLKTKMYSLKSVVLRQVSKLIASASSPEREKLADAILNIG